MNQGDVDMRLRGCAWWIGAAMLSLIAQNTLAIDDDQLPPIMPVDDVRVGMKGYGLTVFAGTKIEPFPVEVISVMRSSFVITPPRGAMIWITCTDPRMLESGAVQGFSGSPIYLWDDGDPNDLGKDGRLIGAFATGYKWSKGCLAGVTPIQQMRSGARRAPDELNEQQAASRHGGPSSAAPLIRAVLDLANAQRLPDDATWRARSILQLMPDANDEHVPYGRVSSRHAMPAADIDESVVASPSMMPVPAGSPHVARLLAPLLEPWGLTPLAAPGVSIGSPPPDIDPDKLEFQPGSVLSLPLLLGDLEAAASGTVTEVWPDGRILALGHEIFAAGHAEIPMATGYAHFVVPSQLMSFRLAGSVQIRGTVVRDEFSGVVGMPVEQYRLSPMIIGVKMLHHPQRKYNFQLVHHRDLAPIYAVYAAMLCVQDVQALPVDNTLHMTGTLRFPEDRQIPIDRLAPQSSLANIILELLPPISAMINNPHEIAMLESMDLNLSVQPQRTDARLVDAHIDQVRVRPGQSVDITAYIQRYGEPTRAHHINVPLPANLPEGQYEVWVLDARRYGELRQTTRPHRMRTNNIDELHQRIVDIVSVRDNALYVAIPKIQPALAVGRQELPQLPSSRRKVLVTPTVTDVQPYVELIEHRIDLDFVPQGEAHFQITVKKHPSAS